MIFIGLGANLPSIHGSPRTTLKKAIAELSRHHVRVLYQSPFYLTAPVPVSDQPWYHNLVIGVSCDLSPYELLHLLQKIEEDFGRVRTIQNAPRVIDLDLLAYHELVNQDDRLTLPHPRLHERAFVLYPLHDIAPNWIHPVLKTGCKSLIDKLPADQKIRKDHRPSVMGIVNVTPDSFSDGGQFSDADTAICHGLKLVSEGADILDIGGESTRPNSLPVTPIEEQRRILPVIEALQDCGALISVDTRNASTMELVLRAGAGMINDVTALEWDKDSIGVVANSDCRICLMHMVGTPETMQRNPSYSNVVDDVFNYLIDRISFCEKNGIARERLIADVGIGFGKSLDHNIELLKNLSRFHDLGIDLLLGTSRKSFIEKICERVIPPSQRLAGSLATIAAARDHHLQIIRVHDVAETQQFLDVYERISEKNCA